MSPPHQTLAAISRLKSGEAALSSEQYVELLGAVEQAVQALLLAPAGSDPVATGFWYNHERAPALARLADALGPHGGGAATHARAAASHAPGTATHGAGAASHRAGAGSHGAGAASHAPGAASHAPGAALTALADQQLSDREVLLELHAALLRSGR